MTYLPLLIVLDETVMPLTVDISLEVFLQQGLNLKDPQGWCISFYYRDSRQFTIRMDH